VAFALPFPYIAAAEHSRLPRFFLACGLLPQVVMPVERYEVRARSGAEVAFIVMRALVGARLLWARGGALPFDALPALVAVPPGPIALAIERLCEEGIAEVPAGARTVRLTERAARELVDTAAVDMPIGDGSPAAA
jgi:hypothetical protein